MSVHFGEGAYISSRQMERVVVFAMEKDKPHALGGSQMQRT